MRAHRSEPGSSGEVTGHGRRPARPPDPSDKRRPEAGGLPRGPRDITIGDIPDAVFATDLENRITHWADSARALFGFSAAEALGQPFGTLLPFRMRDAADEGQLLATIRAGTTWRGEGTVRLRDGSERWIQSTVKPWFVDGELVGSVSVSRDVTDTIEAELRLRGERRFVDGVLDVAGSLVLVLDPSGTVVRFNAACEQLSGYRADEVMGHPIWDLLIPPEELDGVRAAFTDLRAGQFPSTFENHWVRRDGGRRLIAWSSTCLTDDNGAVSHVIGTGTDVTEQRRTEDALRGIADVGQVLASHGPSDESLDAIVGILADRMGYHHLSLLLVDGDRLRVGASRGLAGLPASVPLDRGIVGRVARTGEPAWVHDVRGDPDYLEVRPDVCCEIAVPLRADGLTIGVLDLEATASAPLAERDLRLAEAVAVRIASALILGREQQAQAQRAELLAALSEFARATNGILEPERLVPALMEALTRIFPGDVMTLTTLDRATGRYQLAAVRGVAGSSIGVEVRPGDGPAGRAIEQRAFLGPVELHRADYASGLRDLIGLDALISVAVPLIRDDAVLGAISVGRANLDHPFSPVECEVMQLLGAQAALALANAHLHQEVSELAIHDGLTGLYNRRHFDANLDLIVARWRRHAGASGLAAIMFDLDHFGRFNKEHGHQAGDTVLRVFAGVLRERLRSSDLVARYGGEEFVVILEDGGLGEALGVAEDVRAALEGRTIAGPAGQRLAARVSAGCAAIDPAQPTKEALLQAADVALAMAKRGGRNQVVAI
ncbi:MAG: diguanylate cyclase [Chloroflexota bacterium]